MKLKFTLRRQGGSTVDLIATADARATVGDIAEFLATADPELTDVVAQVPRGSTTLSVVGADTRALDPRLPLGESGLRSGATVTVSRGGQRYQDPDPVGAAVLAVTSGPDTGQEFRLPRGSSLLGREPSCDLTLTDPLVSRQHARINVTDDVEIADLGSANGMLVAGTVVSRCTLRVGDRVVIGDTELTLRTAPTPRGTDTSDRTTVQWVRSPRVEPRFAERELPVPEAPEPPGRQRFPMIPLLAPILMGGILYLISRSVTSLAFVALSPLMLIGNAVESRVAGRSNFKRAAAAFRESLAEVSAKAGEAQRAEVAARLEEHPSVRDCLPAAAGEGTLLWTRRPGDAGFAEFRLGLGRQRSRISVALPDARHGAPELVAEARALQEQLATVDGVPIVARPRESGAVGIAGPRALTLSVARAVLAQAVVLHSPAELILAGFASSTSAADWEWLKWLPHTTSVHSPLDTRHLASTGPDAIKLISELESLLEQRADDEASADGPDILVLVESDAPVEHSRLVELAELGWRHGVYVLWLAPAATQLPAACRTFFDAREAQTATGSVGYVNDGVQVAPVQPDLLDAADAELLSRRLSPIVDVGARIDDDSDLPRSVSLLGLPDSQLAPTSQSVIERWTENRSLITGPYAPEKPWRHAGTLRAVIGQAAGQPHALDLRADGPHALVGGTTGSGKSELLQTWILAMAAAHSPQRLTFLLVDYKGGSAFRDCVDLPHTVGLVTDLSPHLVRRALTSLSAELRHREHILSAHSAKDLVTLEKQGSVEAPPSLIIVVDEFAALVQEVPEFVDGVVNVAQRGRSLGLHLILATQQPAGVIKDKLRANTNLRLALRMADEHDSTDVLGSPQAAFFDPAIPGRSVSKTGPGRLVPFQAGYVGGWTKDEPPPPEIVVEELAFGPGRLWEFETEATSTNDLGPTDIQRLVGAISQASALAEVPEPRKPWLSELRTVYDLSDQRAVPSRRRDDELVFGIQDDPDNQTQPTVVFRPDRDGNLAVYGTGGSGKSTLLRSIAIAASFTVRGGPCHVYGLDFGSRGLSLLGELPHVGSIISGSDDERISRLINSLRATIEERATRYAAVNAGSITEYRRLASAPEEPRLLILVDGLPSFRQAYDAGDRARLFEAFIGICSDGRPVGVHVVLSADRPAAVPTALASTLQRRVILRMADETDYSYAGMPADVLSASSPPGRGMLDERELQVGILGTSPEPDAQARAIRRLASSMRKAGVAQAPRIQRLPELVRLRDLPPSLEGQPVLGLSSETLAAFPFTAHGAFVIAGPPGSGRTTALAALCASVERARPETRFHRLAVQPSLLDNAHKWASNTVGIDDVAAAALDVTGQLETDMSPAVVVLESLPEFLSTPADMALQTLIKAAVRVGHLVLAEGEISAMTSMYPLLSAVRSARAGLSLQPDQLDGSVFKTDFPRCRRADFPVGRGFYVSRGKVATVQVALPDSLGSEQ